MLGRLSGKVATVTGGASGIGEAAARAFSTEGARVALIDLDEENLRRVAGDLGDCFAITTDVSLSAQVESAFDSVVERLGVPDVVVHAAGISDMAAREKRAERLARGEELNITIEMTDEQWRRVMAVDLDATFYVVRAALRRMIPAGKGSIVTLSSRSGIEGAPGQPNYAAAKAGVLGLTRAVAREIAGQGVRINAIAPGPIDTPMSRAVAHMPETRAAMGRWGRPEEVAAAALFLASDESSYITGTTLVVAGGYLTV